MYDLILQLVLMFSLAVIVYLMAAAVPRVKGQEGKNGNGNGIHLDKMDAVLNRWKDKSLRKLKVYIMKTDNYISRQLNKDEEKL